MEMRKLCLSGPWQIHFAVTRSSCARMTVSRWVLSLVQKVDCSPPRMACMPSVSLRLASRAQGHCVSPIPDPVLLNSGGLGSWWCQRGSWADMLRKEGSRAKAEVRYSGHRNKAGPRAWGGSVPLKAVESN